MCEMAMPRRLVTSLLAVLALAIAACGDGDADTTGADDADEADSTTDERIALATAVTIDTAVDVRIVDTDDFTVWVPETRSWLVMRRFGTR